MTVTLAEYANLRRLVAVANNELWYEDDVTAGTMKELTAVQAGDIDTTDQLNMFEAYQKAMVVNGANLKVVDFGNVKLTSEAQISTNIPAKGDILSQYQEVTDKYAYMVVDYIYYDDTDSDHYVYGFAYYAGGATAFTTAHDVKDADGNTIISSGNLSDVANPPHWYDWQVYNEDNTYGKMPLKAYLGCLYNGRAILSGDPTAPNQWYMSRQTNIFDWEYAGTDDGAPVKGGSADLGELGDIVRCLAPYKDDYLIFGCASSIWVMFGDPRAGGQLRELSLTTGIFGANSFCWDNNNYFYFWGDNGLYRTQIPGNPQCISQFKLPRLIKYEAASPSTHRITLLYDKGRHGILVAITVLDTGKNSNYWYDLNAIDEQDVGGLFPETYPNACGIYSGVYYNSNTASLKGLILGNTDGHIRIFDDDVKSDVVGEQSNLIDSFVCIGPMSMSAVPRKNGSLSGIDLTVAGGGSSSSQANSDNVDFKVYSARTSEKVIELATANTNPKIAGSFVGPGNIRGTTRRQVLRDIYMAFRLQNDAVDESWGFEEMSVYLKDSGRKK